MMRNTVLVVLVALLAVMMFGCGDNGVKPIIDQYAKADIAVNWVTDDDPPVITPADNLIMQAVNVESQEKFEFEVNEGLVTITILIGPEYDFSLRQKEGGEEVRIIYENQEVSSFRMGALDLEFLHFSVVAPKPVPTVLALNITPKSAEAEVWIDGDSLGSADPSGFFQTVIDPGSHEIKFIGWGCKEKTISIAISPGETKTQNISLEVWDLSGKWKRESDDRKVDVKYYTWEGRTYVGGWSPAGGFLVKGNKISFQSPPESGSDAYAEGVILENGQRIEFTFYGRPGVTGTLHVYTKNP